jgi:hypothetical protein
VDNPFMSLAVRNRAEPIACVFSGKSEIGAIYRMRILSNSGRAAIKQRDTEEKERRSLRGLNPHNVRRRRCKVKFKADRVRVAWSCVVYNVRFGVFAPKDALRATERLFPTRSAALKEINRLGFTIR